MLAQVNYLSQEFFLEKEENIFAIKEKSNISDSFSYLYQRQRKRRCHTVKLEELASSKKDGMLSYCGHIADKENSIAKAKRAVYMERLHVGWCYADVLVPRNKNSKHRNRSGGFVTACMNALDVTNVRAKRFVEMFFSKNTTKSMVIVLNDQSEADGFMYRNTRWQVEHAEVCHVSSLLEAFAINLHAVRGKETEAIKDIAEEARKFGKEVFLYVPEYFSEKEKKQFVQLCLDANIRPATIPVHSSSRAITFGDLSEENKHIGKVARPTKIFLLYEVLRSMVSRIKKITSDMLAKQEVREEAKPKAEDVLTSEQETRKSCVLGLISSAIKLNGLIIGDYVKHGEDEKYKPIYRIDDS